MGRYRAVRQFRTGFLSVISVIGLSFNFSYRVKFQAPFYGFHLKIISHLNPLRNGWRPL